jgi:hypothetical protein
VTERPGTAGDLVAWPPGAQRLVIDRDVVFGGFHFGNGTVWFTVTLQL